MKFQKKLCEMLSLGKVGVLYKHCNKQAEEWVSAAADPRVTGKREKKDEDNKRPRCKFFEQGKCTKGRRCEFRHAQAHNAECGKQGGEGGKGPGGKGAGEGGKHGGGKSQSGPPPPRRN